MKKPKENTTIWNFPRNDATHPEQNLSAKISQFSILQRGNYFSQKN